MARLGGLAVLSSAPSPGSGGQVYPPAGSRTLRCQWSQWRRWQWCPHAPEGPGFSGILAPQCSSLGPGGGHRVALYFFFPTHPFGLHVHPQPSLLKCVPFFPESPDRLRGTRCWKEQAARPARGLVEKPKLGLPPCSCFCPFLRHPLPPPLHSPQPVHSAQPTQPLCLVCPLPTAHPIPGLLTISVCFWLM